MIRFAKLPGFGVAVAGLALCGAPAAFAQDLKLPSTLTFTAYDTGSSGFNIAVAVGKMFKDKHNADVRVLPAGNDVARLTPLKTGRAQSVRHGHRHLFRARRRVRVRREGMGPAAAAPDARVERLQRHLARRRQGHRRQGGQGPQGEAHRHRGRLSRAQPECLCRARVRRPHAQRREARRVLQLRRDVEGHPQQRGRCRHRLHHLGPGQGGRDLSARPDLSADAARPTRRAGRGSTRSAPTTCRTRRRAASAFRPRTRRSCRPTRIRSS